jgi:hypothetical protein
MRCCSSEDKKRRKEFLFQTGVAVLYEGVIKMIALPQKVILFCNVNRYIFSFSWLLNISGLKISRVPGNTCISSLNSGVCGTVESPINNSKGCGGVMRMAPVGLMWYNEPDYAFKLGCDLAAITHGHPTDIYLQARLPRSLPF